MIKYVAGMNIKRWMTIFRDKIPYLGMSDNFFIHLSLYFGYEDKQYEQDYPLRSKHDHALPDSAGIRASFYNILQAVRSIWRASHVARVLRIQFDNIVLHSPCVHIDYKGMAVSYRKIQGYSQNSIYSMVHWRDAGGFSVHIHVHRPHGQGGGTVLRACRIIFHNDVSDLHISIRIPLARTWTICKKQRRPTCSGRSPPYPLSWRIWQAAVRDCSRCLDFHKIWRQLCPDPLSG